MHIIQTERRIQLRKHFDDGDDDGNNVIKTNRTTTTTTTNHNSYVIRCSYFIYRYTHSRADEAILNSRMKEKAQRSDLLLIQIVFTCSYFRLGYVLNILNNWKFMQIKCTWPVAHIIPYQ